MQNIRVIGARQHNLRNLTVEIPREKLTVITGLSGSGKSTLAFDTIYAEGQRKYVESLSVHARHFLEQIGKPDLDRIEGLPPTLAIEQLAAMPNPRSIVATTTEIYDFLRVLFARVGVPHCPRCGSRLRSRTIDQIVDEVLAFPESARVMVLAPVAREAKGDIKPLLRRIQRDGFVRARVNGKTSEVADLLEDATRTKAPQRVEIVVDRLVVRPDAQTRITEAIELSMRLGEGNVIVSHENQNGSHNGNGHRKNGDVWADLLFSEHNVCTTCNVAMPELTPRLFSFNSPHGACETCDGLGITPRFDEQLIVPDENLALLAGAIAPWGSGKQRVAPTYLKIIKSLCEAFDTSPEVSYRELPADLRRILMHGTTKKDEEEFGVEFEGALPNLERRYRASGTEGARSKLADFRADSVCTTCNGARLKPIALGVRINESNIADITQMSIGKANDWFAGLSLEGESAEIAAPLLHEIRKRLQFMDAVGLSYLTLDRNSATLSGGEAQRIRLATQIGSGLVGVCYVLDEPTIGLHQRDNERLIHSIRNLVNSGNTVIVVEHDEDLIRSADHLIDMGPGAGLHGGSVIAEGPTPNVIASPDSITGNYLREAYRIPVPEERRTGSTVESLKIVGARENNLKNIDVAIPLGVFVAVTGVSGSGKSTLVSQILLPALRRRVNQSRERVGAHERIVGASRIDKVIEIEQTPIGRTPRSNPATFTGVFDEIRELYAKTKEARIRGFGASRFSFNVKGGRCEACQGQGTRRIEMHFLPDVYVTCQDCKGTRYNRETLEIRYRGKSIADVLELRVEEALPFFNNFPKIQAGVRALSDVGLGYLRLGQPSNTLSGGEAQRVKLASELAKGGPAIPRTINGGTNGNSAHTFYVLDEPTTGLHFSDIQTLLAVLNRLVDMGNTVLVIEHNLDVIKNADWIIDLGPEGGDAGGEIVAEGTPEAVSKIPASLTGQHLAKKLR
ncbi:MAG: excinuclease ABC subunit UvrA [Phycisphaerae bacterium]